MADIKDKEYKIAIVGGGVTGVSMLISIVNSLVAKKKKGTLTEKDLNSIKIVVIEGMSQIGFGLPYSSKSNNHILNLDAKTMSIAVPHVEGCDDFIKWIQNNKAMKICENDFLPRYFFGEYINYLAYRVKELATVNGIEVNFHMETYVKSISKKEEYSLIVQSGREIKANYVFLAIGHLPPSNFSQFKGCKGFYPSIWHENTLVDIPTDAKVIIIGTRLTAIDAVLSLQDSGHVGQVIMVSRSGLLPAVLGPIKNYTKKHLTLESLNRLTLNGLKKIKLQQLISLFLQEMEEAGEKLPSDYNSILQPSLSMKEWLSKQIELIQNGITRPWQNVLFSIYPIVPELWASLKAEAKKEFLEKYNSAWMTYLAAFPLQNAKKILNLLENYLEIKDGFKQLIYDKDKNIYTVKFDNGMHCESQYVIDCTGSCYDLEKVKDYSELIKNLIASGLLVPNPYGGAYVNFRNLCAIDASGEEIKDFYVLGELARGDSLATTDLGQVVQHVKRANFFLVKSIVANIRHKNTFIGQLNDKKNTDIAEAGDTYWCGLSNK